MQLARRVRTVWLVTLPGTLHLFTLDEAVGVVATRICARHRTHRTRVRLALVRWTRCATHVVRYAEGSASLVVAHLTRRRQADRRASGGTDWVVALPGAFRVARPDLDAEEECEDEQRDVHPWW